MNIAIVGSTETVGAVEASEGGRAVLVAAGRDHTAKRDQEAEIARSGVPWTIVCATQYHAPAARKSTGSQAVPIPCSRSLANSGAGRGAFTFDASPAS